jgi:hypothetical protein
MTQHQSSRTLVKSAPELWAECSDAASLARHLGAFGEIRITKLEPETAVAWEGTAARGTVKLEPSGWGTRVTLTLTEETAPVAAGPVDAAPADRAPDPTPAVEAPVAVVESPAPVESPVALEPAQVAESPAPVESPVALELAPVAESPAEEPPVRPGLFARLFLRLRAPRPEELDPEMPEPEASEADAPESAAPEVLEPAAPEAEALEPEAPEAEAPEPATPEIEAAAPAAPQPEAQGEAALTAALDSLGRAHHRPYSRA